MSAAMNREIYVAGLGPPRAATALRYGLTGTVGPTEETGIFHMRVTAKPGCDGLAVVADLARLVPELDLYVFQRQADGTWLLVEYEDGQELDRSYGHSLDAFYDETDEDSLLTQLAAEGVLAQWD